MGVLFGTIGIGDSEYAFNSTTGQRLIWDETQRVVRFYNEEMTSFLRVFMEAQTSDHIERYKLPGSGYLQMLGTQSQPHSIKAAGGWDVAYPLEGFGDEIETTDVDRGYMTLGQWENHVQSVLNRHANTLIHQALRPLLNNTNRTFVDPNFGSLTCKPLANNDADLYPPVLAATADAAAQHYLATAYASAAISDTNNPIPPMVRLLEQRYGTPTGGSPIAVFHHYDELDNLQGLTDFVEVIDMQISPGDNVSELPMGSIPDQLGGTNITWRIHGRLNGATLVQWDRIPSGYLVGIHMGMGMGDPIIRRPLKMRVDPDGTGLNTGLSLVSRGDANWPFDNYIWRHRFGFAVGNRTNGVVTFLAGDSVYDIPTGFTY